MVARLNVHIGEKENATKRLWKRKCVKEIVKKKMRQRDCGKENVSKRLWKRKCDKEIVEKKMRQRDCENKNATKRL